MKTKRGQIIAKVFIYVLGLVIIAIILIMGYNYISTTEKEIISKTDLLLLKNKLTSDVESISSDFESEKKVSYSVPGSAELCLVDLRPYDGTTDVKDKIMNIAKSLVLKVND